MSLEHVADLAGCADDADAVIGRAEIGKRLTTGHTESGGENNESDRGEPFETLGQLSKYHWATVLLP